MEISLVNIHPVVVATALDQYRRRNEHQDRVIGVLFGFKNADTIEIRTAFPVLHSEDEGISVGKEIIHNLLNLHKQVAPSEVLIGWYATREEDVEFDEKIYLVHDYFINEIVDPIFVQIDTFGKTVVKAFNCSSIEQKHDRVFGSFTEISVETVASTLTKSFLALEENESAIKTSLRKFTKDIETAQSILNDETVSDETKSKIKEILENIPSPDSPEFAKSFNKGLHDLLMVSYLSNLTKAQLSISDKLSK